MLVNRALFDFGMLAFAIRHLKIVFQVAAVVGFVLTIGANAEVKRYESFVFDTANPEVLILAGSIDLRSALTFQRAPDNHLGTETKIVLC